MSPLSESELREIVLRVIQQTTGQTSAGAVNTPAPSSNADLPKKVIALGADHGGFELKEILKKDLAEAGYSILDVGTNSKDAVDYPDFAHAVASQVASGKAWRGVIIDGAGIGSCMVANKVPGVRAALAYDLSSAINSREHNDANVLTLGAGLIGVNLARQILKTWLETAFAGGRHSRRVEKITAIEKEYLKGG